MSISISSPSALNEIGKRSNNEDNIFPQKGMASAIDKLFIVCDGMGGHEKGEAASEIVCKSIADYFSKSKQDKIEAWDIAIAFENAQRNIDTYIIDNPTAQGMGTTLSMVYINKNNIIAAHCGDSRIYQIRQGKIVFKSQDHSLVNELLRSGIINEQEAENHPKKNVITRAMQGSSSPVKADISFLNVQQGDFIFLCSDGVLESFSDKQLCTLISSNISNEEKTSQINANCLENSKDNYSCYLIKIENAPEEKSALALPEQKTIILPKEKTNNKLFLLLSVVFLITTIVFASLYIMGNISQKPDKTKTRAVENNEAKLWIETLTDNELESYENYISKFPDGEYVKDAELKIKNIESEMEDKEAWEECMKLNTIEKYKEYSENNPDSKYASWSKHVVEIILDLTAYEEVLKVDRANDKKQKAEEYLEEFENGLRKEEIEKIISIKVPSITSSEKAATNGSNNTTTNSSPSTTTNEKEIAPTPAD